MSALPMETPPRKVVTVAEAMLELLLEEAREKLLTYLPIWERTKATGKLGVELDLKDGKPVGKMRVLFAEHVAMEK